MDLCCRPRVEVSGLLLPSTFNNIERCFVVTKSKGGVSTWICVVDLRFFKRCLCS